MYIFNNFHYTVVSVGTAVSAVYLFLVSGYNFYTVIRNI